MNIAVSMYTEAYLKSPKLTRSEGLSVAAAASRRRPADSTPSSRRKP